MKNKNIILFLWITFIVIVFFISFLFFSIQKNHFNLYGELPSLEDLEKPKSELSSELYSADNVILGKYFRYNRTPTRFNELSNELIETILVTEDIRFYEHSDACTPSKGWYYWLYKINSTRARWKKY